MINHLPRLLTNEENEEMVKLLEEKEVKEAIFSLNENSVGGPDGFAEAFY